MFVNNKYTNLNTNNPQYLNQNVEEGDARNEHVHH